MLMQLTDNHISSQVLLWLNIKYVTETGICDPEGCGLTLQITAIVTEGKVTFFFSRVESCSNNIIIVDNLELEIKFR